MPNLVKINEADVKTSAVILAKDIAKLNSNLISKDELAFLKKLKDADFPYYFNRLNRHDVVVKMPSEKEAYKNHEKLRILGYSVFKYIKQHKINSVQIVSDSEDQEFFIEGLLLSSYKFEKYKTKDVNPFDIEVKTTLSKEKIAEISNLIEMVFYSRTLVNEPQSYLNAPQLSEELTMQAKKCGVSIEVFDKKKIEKLKMGGLLAVNRGSLIPPTFNILEYKPKNAKNKQPIIFVGKGVVYDTGGLSLKPTPQSMDQMKCDMSGAAAVAGALFAIALNKLPYHIISLIPATDNRPGGDAYAPGDVLTMYNGSTVEVLNTDAEGRLILADALHYAAQYKPELVIDLATLTGAAMRAIGKEATVMMGTASIKDKQKLTKSGEDVYERLVEFPLWDEYMDSLKSDIADIKNLGGANAGATTAGKFLETFVSYPWIHLDIAATAFLEGEDKYRGKWGTGVGVRLLYNFVKNLSNEK